MKTVKNRLWSPRILALPGDDGESETITVAARGTVELSESAFASPECQKLVADRSLIVLPESSY